MVKAGTQTKWGTILDWHTMVAEGGYNDWWRDRYRCASCDKMFEVGEEIARFVGGSTTTRTLGLCENCCRKEGLLW